MAFRAKYVLTETFFTSQLSFVITFKSKEPNIGKGFSLQSSSGIFTQKTRATKRPIKISSNNLGICHPKFFCKIAAELQQCLLPTNSWFQWTQIIDSKVCCEKGAEIGKIYYAFDGHSISNKYAELWVPKKMLLWASQKKSRLEIIWAYCPPMRTYWSRSSIIL